MIIKSMSRNTRSFAQLYDYLTRDKSSFAFARNTYASPRNKKEFVHEFYENAAHLKNARGKLYIYHEVLSLEENELSPERQKEILLDMADKYLQARAAHHLSFGVVHHEKNNVHLHLMISANELEGNRRIRLSKSEFARIQKALEAYKNENYKELGKSSLYSNKKDLSKEKQNEQELKNRGVKSTKDQIREDLKNAFSKASSNKQLERHLASLGYELYTRGKTQGIRHEKKNYRLKTLGLEKEYLQLCKNFEKVQQRELKRQRAKADRSFTRER